MDIERMPGREAGAVALLDADGVLEHLRRCGVLMPGEPATARLLGGGVSNVVALVEAASRRVVVKQALPRLRVAKEWLADPCRTATEGRALRLAATVIPNSVPAVVDLDEARNVLVIDAAPPPAHDWKQRLLHGEVGDDDIEVAGRLGALIGRLHVATAARGALAAEFDCWTAFEQLRVAPYFESMTAERPDLAAVVLPHVEAMRDRGCCLVHGDASPKNVLVGPDMLWLIDFEVACWGDPAFDVSFMLCHLAMKAIHRPGAAVVLRRAAENFLAAYASVARNLLDERHVAGLLGCLLLARVDGRSPAEYLSDDERTVVRARGLKLASSSPSRLAAAMRYAQAAAW